MRHKSSYRIKTFLAVCVLFINSCSGASTANVSSSQIFLVGSTPGDALIKSSLGIPFESPVDFIRWNLILNPAENKPETYVLNIIFGAAQPNTLGFKNGGEKLAFEGLYTVSKSQNREIYELKNERAQTFIALVKLNDNLFHILTPEGRLMVGNGGWSYTLNRRDLTVNVSPLLSSWISELGLEPARETIFEGRTPCADFARQYNLQVGNDCFKLKWKLTLLRDSKTGQPTTYTLKTPLNHPNTTEGKWAIIKGIKTNPEAIIYQLDPDKPDQSLSFLVGDENVLFFLDRKNQLFTGNSDFSFTLNRRKQ